MKINLIEQPITFYTTDKIYDMAINDQLNKINLKQCGVKYNPLSGERLILSDVLYKKSQIKRKPYTLYVDQSSLDKDRFVIVQFLLDDIARRKQKGNTPATIKAFIRDIGTFCKWLTNENIKFSKTIKEAKQLYHMYMFYLKNNIKAGNMAHYYARTLSSNTLQLLVYVFDDYNGFISSGISPIPAIRLNVTEKASNEDFIYSFNFFHQLFSQLADFILEEKQYPFLLNLPRESLWVIPSRTWVRNENTEHYLKSYNYKTGQIKSVKEIQKAYGFKDEKTAYDYRNSFMYKLHNNNVNTKSNTRMFLGRVAMKAYFMHFLAITGMNDSTAGTLKWNDQYEINKEQYNFRNIKYRAQNKLVEFKIQKEFVTDFKKFIQLREYLLDGHKIDYLFFSHDRKKAQLSPRQMKGSYSSLINTEMIKNIDPQLPRITSKQLRINKIYQVIKQNGIVAASNLAQNLPSTILSKYVSETTEDAMEQFTEFFNQLNKDIIFKENEGIDISVGQCKQLNNPNTKLDINPFDSNCSQGEGCLFCDKYGIHADEIDFRKLYSLEYLINECKYIASDNNIFESVYGNILSRITNIIEFTEEQVPTLKSKIQFVKRDVYENENLTPYFEHKLNTLLELGVLK
ncbi:hypothetical protein Q6A75_09340 [Aliarcobacter skirrowii]|uniref:hypothetical protein n=1 Tax=Aliarcobacter skirrowii TaxID=28200 RepID=UPI0029A569B2|nr:hypothetical protein [Aliarcobacter skirrowii]MDX4049127.1 hypothetical protein [Aliarcobacter skirrowii]